MALTLDGDNGISGINGSAATPAVQGTDTNTGLTFGTDTVGVVTGGTTRTTVDSSGRLLVGTSTARSNFWAGSTSPVLQVEGTSYNTSSLGLIANNTSSFPYPTLFFGKSAGSSTGSNTAVSSDHYLGQITFQGTDGTNFIAGAEITARVDGTPGSNDMPGRLIFSTTADGASSPTERMRLTSLGYLKASNSGSYVSASSRIHSLESNATTGDELLTIYGTAASGSSAYGVLIKYTANTPNNTAYALSVADATATRAQIRNNGGIANYQSNDVNLCDEREKKNIVDLDSTWDCLKHWELKKFHYNEDADDADLRYGVIAQQVAPHCPEVITEWYKQRAEDAVLDDDGNVVTEAKEEIVRMGVKEQQMMWMAIKALQEAQTRIEQLETRVAQLEGGAA